jgi:hypothetical protein
MGGGFLVQPSGSDGDKDKAPPFLNVVEKRFDYAPGWKDATRDGLAEELVSRGLSARDERPDARWRLRELAPLFALAALVALVLLGWFALTAGR